ncbi:MAG: hypothetical protein Q8868_02620 [Bacteroidota bacterium]|nr:hypothetical protein [Bacteroidota bacterium]
MGRTPVSIPLQAVEASAEPAEWGNLKNRFSAKALFRSDLYFLETGDLSVLDTISNKWFFEELFSYALIKHDGNLIPALKKIAGAARFDESVRQRASEIVEIIEEETAEGKERVRPGAIVSEEDKIENARKMLAGARYPHTSDILKLLRDKSMEAKRLALFLVGKFKMTDMVQEVCDCLNIPGLREDAFSVLATFGNAVSKQITSFYLVSSGNTDISKTILRLFSKTCPYENMPFIVERLWSGSRQLREHSLKTLIGCNYRAGESHKERLHRLVYETFSNLAWIMSAKMCLYGNNDHLIGEFEREYRRWRSFLFNLLILTYGSANTTVIRKELGSRKNGLKNIPGLADILFGETLKSQQDFEPDQAADKKYRKKLEGYFHYGILSYEEFPEEVINCDYNLLSVWTKACTIRELNTINNGNLEESVIALLFSPEEILQEEAAKLISRSNREIYLRVSDRLHDQVKRRIDGIIASETDSRELIYEKTRFLASLFPQIPVEELLYLSSRMSFLRNDKSGIFSQPSGTVLWSFSDGSNDFRTFVNFNESTDMSSVIRDLRTSFSFCYLLPLNAVREFHFIYPESSWEIFKYIDDNEE